LLLASRTQTRREAEAGGAEKTEEEETGAVRRQIRPDCGRRNRGIEAVDDAMAGSG
jgi:hypothetical protein